MTEEELLSRLERAQRRQQEIGWSDRAAALVATEEVLAAERALAACRGEQYAEVIDIGLQWNIGAPLPHLICNGSRAFLVCYVGQRDPAWDGTYVQSVSPDDGRIDLFGVIELSDCASVRLGAPNDEALPGHPLYGRGLVGYAAHEVHGSSWLAEHILINSVHPQHTYEPWLRLHHYLLAFHDEMFEAVAAGIRGRVVHDSLQPLLDKLTRELISPSNR